jgi:hypothetical protein
MRLNEIYTYTANELLHLGACTGGGVFELQYILPENLGYYIPGDLIWLPCPLNADLLPHERLEYDSLSGELNILRARGFVVESRPFENGIVKFKLKFVGCSFFRTSKVIYKGE